MLVAPVHHRRISCHSTPDLETHLHIRMSLRLGGIHKLFCLSVVHFCTCHTAVRNYISFSCMAPLAQRSFYAAFSQYKACWHPHILPRVHPIMQMPFQSAARHAVGHTVKAAMYAAQTPRYSFVQSKLDAHNMVSAT